MSGELLLEKKTGGRYAVTLLLACDVAGAVPAAHGGLGVDGHRGAAVLCPVPGAVSGSLSAHRKGGGRPHRHLDGDGGRVGPGRPVHFQKQHQAGPLLAQPGCPGAHRGGLDVNIDTQGKNQVLRSLKEGEDVERSARQLRALVIALGYQSRWPEE